MRSEELVELAIKENAVKLKVFFQDEDWVAIEGDSKSLEFLGRLLLAFSKEEAPALTFDAPELRLFEKGSDGLIFIRKA